MPRLTPEQLNEFVDYTTAEVKRQIAAANARSAMNLERRLQMAVCGETIPVTEKEFAMLQSNPSACTATDVPYVGQMLEELNGTITILNSAVGDLLSRLRPAMSMDPREIPVAIAPKEDKPMAQHCGIAQSLQGHIGQLRGLEQLLVATMNQLEV